MGIKIFVPKIGANIEIVRIGNIYVKQGDNVKRGQILFEITTNKATFDIEADATGKILTLNCKEGDEFHILDEIGFIGKEGEIIPDLKTKTSREGEGEERPVIQKTTKEKDTTKHIQNEKQNEDIEIEKISFRKEAEIKNLSKSKEYICSSVSISISAAKIKQKIKEYSKKNKIRLTLLGYISYTTASLLKKFTKLNAYYTLGTIQIYKNINLGIAMNLNDDLIVPVINNADSLSLPKFLSKLNGLIMKTIKDEIEIKDMENNTFTITDPSSFGVLHFTPVINSNQSAILGICSEYDSCTLKNGKLIYDPKINLTLAFDHRVFNGKYALAFLNELKENLQHGVINGT